MKTKITVFLLIMSVAILSFGCSSEDHDGEAKTPSASSAQKGRDYQSVIEDFEEHGFTNIVTNPQDDLITGWVTKEGEVEKVSVDGDEDYSSDKWYPEDVEVIITYHTFPEVEEEETSKKDELSEESQSIKETESDQEEELTKDTELDKEELEESPEESPEDDEDAEIRGEYGISINDISWNVIWRDIGHNQEAAAFTYRNNSDKTITDLYFTFCQKDDLTDEEVAAIDELYEDHISIWLKDGKEKKDVGATVDAFLDVAPGVLSDTYSVNAEGTSFMLTSMDQYNAMQPEEVKITYQYWGNEMTVCYNFLTDTYSTDDD